MLSVKGKAAVILLLFLAGGLIFIPTVQGAYISHSLINNYSYDLNTEETFTSFMSYQLELEQRLDFNSYLGNLYLTPELTYYYDDEWDFNLNEAYVDAYFTDFDLRIGRQNINWGKADGLVVTNIVTPEDFSTYPVVEYEDRFQSIDAVKLNYYQELANYEVVWIPEFKGVNSDKNNLISQLQAEMDLAGAVKPEIDYSQLEPETKLENSELAVRYSRLGREVDYEFIAGYLWDDYPVFHIKRDNPPVITPKHHRYWAGGGSFSTTYNNFLFKGEGLFAVGKKYNTTDFKEAEDGVVEKNNLKWLLGTEYSYKDYLFSLQYLQEYLLDYEEEIIQDELSGQLTAMVQGQFLRNTLESSATLFYDLSRESLKIKPEISYDYSDKINFKLGGDYFLEEGNKAVPGLSSDVLYFQSEFLF